MLFYFSFFRFFSAFFSVPFFLLFSLPGRRLPSQSDSCFRCGRKGHLGKKPTVEDSGADTILGVASERRPKVSLSAPPGASKASQNNDVDIIENEETHGLFEDFVKADSSVHDFEIKSGNSVLSTKCNVKGRLRAHVGFWERGFRP